MLLQLEQSKIFTFLCPKKFLKHIIPVTITTRTNLKFLLLFTKKQRTATNSIHPMVFIKRFTNVFLTRDIPKTN